MNTLALTDNQRRALVDLSDQDWQTLVPHHPRSVVQRLYALGLIRCDTDHETYDMRIWTITQRGLDVLEVSQ
uniref:hypothetical protein n=1 Tax=Yoonia sp. TaxID=2212373 RepID=UPI0040489E4D